MANGAIVLRLARIATTCKFMRRRRVRFRQGPDKRCRFNRSMQHHLINCSANASREESICLAVLGQNLAMAVLRLTQPNQRF
jgi:hypothetical protein